MPLISVPGRHRQVDLCEFKASLVYKSYFPNRHQKLQRNPVSKKIIFIHSYVFKCTAWTYTTHHVMLGAEGGVVDPLELVLWMVISQRVG